MSILQLFFCSLFFTRLLLCCAFLLCNEPWADTFLFSAQTPNTSSVESLWHALKYDLSGHSTKPISSRFTNLRVRIRAPAPRCRHGIMDSLDFRVTVEETTFTIPIMSDLERLKSIEQRIFAYRVLEMDPELSIKAFAASSLESLLKATMLRLDSPPKVYSEQICAGFRIREYTTPVEGAQERVCVDLLEVLLIPPFKNLLISTDMYELILN